MKDQQAMQRPITANPRKSGTSASHSAFDHRPTNSRRDGAERPQPGVSLRDILSRLTLSQAKRAFGADIEKWMRAGAALEIDIAAEVTLTPAALRWRRTAREWTTIFAAPAARDRMRLGCSCGSTGCEHRGALVGLVLEEKIALGLAAPPQEKLPLERLTPTELEARMLQERQTRAATEPMTVRPVQPDALWSDYTVTSGVSGKTHRVALRGWERGESYCSCPDFQTNTLGVCKHIFRVMAEARKRFSPARCRQPFTPSRLALYLAYGQTPELRVQMPPGLPTEVQQLLAPLAGQAIANIHDLLARVRRLEALGQPVLIFPDAEEFIQQWLHQERIRDTVQEIRRDTAQHPLRRELLKMELLPYQLDGIAFAVGAGRAILADDMGLGKTIQGIGVAELLAREVGIRRVLVVCPVSLKSQWAAEARRFSTRAVQLVQGSAEERASQYQGNVFFTVANYEQILRDITVVEQATWDLIILDEGQRIKNWEAKTSRVIKGMRSRFALVLSGTPMENRLEELFSVVEFIDAQRLGPAFRFFHTHRDVDERGKVLGYKKLDDLRARLKPVLLRRTRSMVMTELPPRTTELVRITPTQEQAEMSAEYLRIVTTIVRKSFITEMDLLRLQKYLLLARMAANGTFLVNKQTPNYSSKLDELDDMLGTFVAEEERKVIIFSEWTTMLNLIEPLLQKRNAAFVRLDGSVPQKQRAQLVHQFQTDPACRFFLTSNAGSTGLNLQAANTVVNVDLPWNPAVLEQRIARAHRMGQKRPVQVYLLVTENTMEEKLLSTLSAKKELAIAALDIESELTSVQLQSGISELKQRLEVLLGSAPPAPVDESRAADKAAEANALAARREEVATAGGQLLGAAFAFLGKLLAEPTGDSTAATERATALVRERLGECIQKDEQGRTRLTVTLSGDSALDGMAQVLARLAALAPLPKAP